MAGFQRVRRLLLVNALIFAVLAAAVTLAYYGYRSTEGSSRERDLEQLRELAMEKVVYLENQIIRDDLKIFNGPMQLDQLVNKLAELASGVHVVSVFVLDDQLKLVPGGYVSSRDPKEGQEFRDRFQAEIVPDLGLERLAACTRSVSQCERGHVHMTLDGKPHLFSMMKRAWGDKVHYIVIEEDLIHLVLFVFPQFFTLDRANSKRLYQVVDEGGKLRYGLPVSFGDDAPSASVRFVDTVDAWSVRVTEAQDPKLRKQLERKRLIDSLFIGGAITVILTGLAFLALAGPSRASQLKRTVNSDEFYLERQIRRLILHRQ
jgi:hypothetical protein